VRLRVDRFVPIETEREFLRSGLSLDLGIHENRTTHVEHASLFTPGLYRIANRIYDRDFEELGYSRR
jgi:hypothetical protein